MLCSKAAQQETTVGYSGKIGETMMKQGDFVYENWYGNVDASKWGIVLEKVYDKRAQRYRLFTVLWQDGTVGNNVWDYDLTIMEAS
jgi:hypothetical protein